MIRVLPEISAALAAGHPVVALESSVLGQGLPIPANRDAWRRMTDAVTRHGALPAITAVVAGEPAVGITDAELERFLARDGVRKVTARDLGIACALGQDGATTVAATLTLAASAGIDVFATGGIGGVHRDAPYDESADLVELARRSVIVVCAGAKSILDLAATWERLETLGVPVVGYGTDELPGFFTRGTGIQLTARVDDVRTLCAAFAAHRRLGRTEAMVVVQPPPADVALDRETVDGAVRAALDEARASGLSGAAVTPFLLAAVARATDGATLAANLGLLEANAALAAQIAVAWAAEPRPVVAADPYDNANRRGAE